MYKFPLRAVLNHRKFLEENLQKDLGLLKKVLFDERKKLSDLKRDRTKFSMELQKKQKKSINISETLIYVRYIEELSNQLDRQKETTLDAEKEVNHKRKKLIEAIKNRKILDKLKEKGYASYKHDMLRDEQNFINEMASVRFKHGIQD
jgi:flagellar protein FliJ